MSLQKITDPELTKLTLVDPNQILAQWRQGLEHYQKFVGIVQRQFPLDISRNYCRGKRSSKGILISGIPRLETRALSGWCRYLGIKFVDSHKLINHGYKSIEEGTKIIFTKEWLYPATQPQSYKRGFPYGEEAEGHAQFCEDLSAEISPIAIGLLLCGMSHFCKDFSLPTPQFLLLRCIERSGDSKRVALMIAREKASAIKPTEIRLIEIPDFNSNNWDVKINKASLAIPVRCQPGAEIN